jgi:HPt (histidine-containing phosphotransfer) domain-containing protein
MLVCSFSEAALLMDNTSTLKLLEEKLNAIKMNFISSLKEKKDDIINARDDLEKNGYSPERLALLHALVHKLAGTAAAFELKALSEACSEADIYLRPFVKENKAFSNEYMPEITDKVNMIEKCITGLNE